jgi:hypothetical protein
MKKTQKVIRLDCELDVVKQRRLKAEMKARTLRIATVRWRQKVEPPARQKVLHP